MKLLNLLNRQKPTQRNNIYRFCNELPIHNFNEVISKGDLSYLKKDREDKIPNHILQSVWLDIMDEYFTLTNNPKALMQLKRKMQIMILEKKINVLQLLSYCISKGINVEKELSDYKVTKLNISQHLGMLKNDISKKIAALPEDVENDKYEFDKTIAVLLSRGFSVNRFKTVVSEWVAMLAIIEQQNKVQQQ